MSGIRTNGAGPHDTRREQELAELPMAQLLRRLSDQTSLLVREEVALAKAELSEKGKRAGVGAGLLGGGATFGFLALATIIAAIVGLLDRPRPVLSIPRWRGGLVRLFAAWPRGLVHLLPLLISDARRKQRKWVERALER